MNNRIKKYKTTEIDYTEPHTFYDNLDRDYMSSFLTGEGPEDISGTSVIGIKPYRNITISDMDTLWDQMRKLNNSTNFDEKSFPVNKLGAIGFISYEALHSLEKVDKKTIDHISFPLFNWTIYREYYYFDKKAQKAWYITIDYIEDIEPLKGKHSLDSGFFVNDLTPDFSPDEYKSNVELIREEILKGEVYEVNLTQGIKGAFSGSPYSLFKKLYKENASPYSAYLERDNYNIVSNSPELFLSCEGKCVETRPIKGTAPRSLNKITDIQLKDELMNSLKNQAELYMIVDLMRNDISRVCSIGSVKVVTPKRVETYKNVHHLVSIIQGTMNNDKDYIDLFKSTFPGGSITGCPKVRCMQLTEEIEKSSRNLYTGTIYIMNKKFLRSSIVIRSCVIKEGTIVFNSGGAVTIDSDPEEEYNESIVKLKSIFKAVGYEEHI